MPDHPPSPGPTANPGGRLPRFEDHANQQTKYTTCYMCACRCGIKVTLENDKVRFIQGNPRHPVNQGVLCAKGNAGIMKQESRAKLDSPLLRIEGAERGEGRFKKISWDEALDILTRRLDKIRKTDPKQLAFFTGRDQMQALTGLWAQQFGTVNWAAHGGFCSVNMAAAGLYTLGHSFWEFGEPDWERSRYFMLWGVAEDHSSNPLKLGIEKLKRNGAKFVAVNPVRTGYQAIADEWVPIRPGSDAMLALAMCRVLLERDLFDWEFLIRYTNAPHLVAQTPGGDDEGLIVRDADGAPLVYDLDAKRPASGLAAGTQPALFGEYATPDGGLAKTAFTLFAERCMSDDYALERAAEVCGVPAKTIERLALEMAHVAFRETVEIPCEWTDWTGRKHDRFVGRPVSMHAMRGVSAHSNGFQACRALHILQTMLGAIDCPGGHRAKAPYPKHIPPPIKPARESRAGEPLPSPPLGFPTSPADLAVDAGGKPRRIDKAYSWEAPLANHGMLHMVISNAVNGDPYPIDTLLLFMANLAWNSSMNTSEVREMLKARDETGAHKIPFLAVVDAFDSEMVAFADLVLPDTTYLERYDAISLLDRPISEPDGVCDSIRAPVLEPDRDVRPWQEVMIDLAVRLGLPAFVEDDGAPRYRDYRDFITRYEKAPGVGFLAGWRGGGAPGEAGAVRGKPNPDQWERYIENECFFHYSLPERMRFFRFANRDYLRFAKDAGFNASDEPIVIQLYSEVMQTFRLAAAGRGAGPKPPDGVARERIETFFDPLPFHYEPLEQARVDAREYPLHAITQRPMAMYHSWDSQNAWLRQIMSRNYIYLNRRRAKRLGVADLDWVWIESRNGKVRAQARLVEGVQADTVWTWNAIGKQAGAWGLETDADEARQGFLLNHLIDERLPPDADGRRRSNSDPITGQAAWYDLRVKIYPADEPGAWPQFPARPAARAAERAERLRYQTHAAVKLERTTRDILSRGRD